MKGIEQAGTEALQRGRSLLTGLYSSAQSLMVSSSLSKPSVEDVELHGIEKQSPKKASYASLPAKSTDRLSVPDRKPSSAIAKSPERASVYEPKSPVRHPSTLDKAKKTLQTEPTKSQLAAIENLKLLNPNGRLDYVLQESVLENPYLSSLAAHMTYWPDTDVNSLIVRALLNIKI